MVNEIYIIKYSSITTYQNRFFLITISFNAQTSKQISYKKTYFNPPPSKFLMVGKHILALILVIFKDNLHSKQYLNYSWRRILSSIQSMASNSPKIKYEGLDTGNQVHTYHKSLSNSISIQSTYTLNIWI